MKALRLSGWQAAPELADVAIPVAGPGQVLLKVAGAGLCESDLKLMEWPGEGMPYALPFTLGHETSGWVAATGEGVTGLDEGDAVLVYGAWGCGHCWPCSGGMENACERAIDRGMHGGGLGADGGLAEYLVVPDARHLVRLGGLDPVISAPLADAALTPYHAISRALPLLVPGATAVVIGITGGLGHLAVQLLRVLSPARVIAIDANAEARSLAERLGADAVFPPDAESEAIREVSENRGASLVLDLIGTQATLDLAASLVGIGGEIAITGLGGGAVPVGFGRVPLECTVRLPNWGTRPELNEVVALARARAFETHVEVCGLDEARDAYGRLSRGEVLGRAVVAPHE